MFVVMLLSIFLFGSITAFAAESDIPDATSQFYVNDFANIISDDVEKEMQERAVALAEATDGVQVVVTTVQTIGNADPVYYTVDMYNKYGIGKNNMGVLIMLSVETRDIQVRIGDNMTKYLSDRKSGEIIDEYGIPYFKNDEFAEGLYQMQNATIEHIASKVQSAEDEVAVTPTDVETLESKGLFGMAVGIMAVICGGVASFFGIDKLLKKRKEEKEAEKLAMIENSEQVRNLKQTIQNLKAQVADTKQDTAQRIDAKNAEIKSLTRDLEATKTDLLNLKERYKRAVMAYPDLDEKVDAIFAREKEEADKKMALGVENELRRVLVLECTRQNLYTFENAYRTFNNLSCEQQKYVSTDLVENVKKLYEKSEELQREFEEAERIRINKEKAEEVQKLILSALACRVTRHSLYNLTSVCRAYDNLTNEQKQYITADVQNMYAMMSRAQRLQDEYEEEERRRRRREEEEERRRRESYSRSHSSFGGGSFGGFGGHSGGHGAGRKF